MKKLLFVLFGLIPFATQAQTDSLPPPVRLNRSAPQLDNKQQLALEQAGLELQRFSRQYYIGLGMMAAGFVVTSAATVTSTFSNNSSGGAGALLGAVLILGGYVVQITSHGHVGRAGRYLREAGACNG